MNMSAKKTKDTSLGPIRKDPLPLTEFEIDPVERKTSFKLFGPTTANNLNWDDHINAISVKASKRLYFIELLKRSSVTCGDLLQYYKSIINRFSNTLAQSDNLGFLLNNATASSLCSDGRYMLISGSQDNEARCVFILTSSPSVLRLTV
jgi:hypothetical protein